MATIGSLTEFDVLNPSSWDLYSEQLTYFLEANGITDDGKKRATLISVCGIKTVGIIRSLIAPAGIADKTFSEIILALKNYFNPRASIIYSRFLFHKRMQGYNEGIKEYVTVLRSLAEDCNFGNTLSERLRDQLVCGIRDEAVQRRLLAETDLKFEDAVSKALAYETAASQVREMHSQHTSRSSSDSVDYVRKDGNQYSVKPGENFVRQNCYGCGESHERTTCRFRNAVCRSCGLRGHIQKVCRSKGKNKQSSRVSEVVASAASDDYCLNSVQKCKFLKQNVFVEIEGRILQMEVDSGSFYSIISYDTFNQIFESMRPKIIKTPVKLSDFQKNKISLRGKCFVNVKFKSYCCKLELLIANSPCTSILGYSWFERLGISISGVNFVANPIDEVLDEFSEVFKEGLGSYSGPEVRLPIDPRVPPIRCKARNVPLALRAKIETALNDLIREGVIEPIDNPKWATPVVPVLKPSGEVRLCGDYKVTLNKAMSAFPYPIPAINNLLSNLKGGGYYAKIDLAQAYLQLRVDKESAEAQTIITHKGAFKVNRLQFGVNVAPGLFQSIMESLLVDIKGVVPYFDDVLVRAESLEELALRLRHVLSRLKNAGFRAKKEKCLFGVKEVEFLGFRVDAEGIHPSRSKVEAIRDAPIPKDKQRLQAFLGLINFYHSFLKDKATVAEPLHRLLDSNTTWEWTRVHSDAFESLKKLISSENVLVPFDESLPIMLTCDASPYGVGSVLSHKLPDGREAPIAFSSRTLTSAERNYAQIDKEALAIVSGVKKFHHFLFGHKFTVITDHQPLLGLFSRTKATPEIISPRMLRWSLMLNAYDFEILHRPGKSIRHADALSRLPKPIPEFDVPPPLEVLFVEDLESPPLSARQVARLTLRDRVLSRVLNFVLKGWPEQDLGSDFHTYFTKRNELSVHKNCILWGNRVVIPEPARLQVMQELHLAHIGIERMKSLARSYVWWPGMDCDIHKYVSSCSRCQETRHAPPRAPVHPWEVTTVPWSRLHIDFAGPFQGRKFLIIVDSFSKWVDVKLMSSTTASSTIDVLRDVFSTHGIPDSVVSDNGPPFSSQEYQTFLESNAVRPVLVAPRRAAGNGQAERVVQTVKDSLKRIIWGSWQKRLAQFLLYQHVTPSTSTSLSPAELLMGRRLRTCLDRLHPDFIRDQREKQELSFEKNHRPVRRFSVDDPVYVKNYSQGREADWVPAIVVQPTGPVSYKAETVSGDVVRRHVDQMRRRETGAPLIPAPTKTAETDNARELADPEPKETPISQDHGETPAPSTVLVPPVESTQKTMTPTNASSRPRRVTRQPKRYPL